MADDTAPPNNRIERTVASALRLLPIPPRYAPRLPLIRKRSAACATLLNERNDQGIQRHRRGVS